MVSACGSIEEKPTGLESDEHTQKTEKRNEREDASQEKQTDTVVLSIIVSSDEIILDTMQIPMKDGETALGVLETITKEKDIQREISSSGYVRSIGNLGEFDRGSGSGWMYLVNDTIPTMSAKDYVLQAGDRVEWVYTLDQGKDIGVP